MKLVSLTCVFKRSVFLTICLAAVIVFLGPQRARAQQVLTAVPGPQGVAVAAFDLAGGATSIASGGGTIFTGATAIGNNAFALGADSTSLGANSGAGAAAAGVTSIGANANVNPSGLDGPAGIFSTA